MKIKRLVFVVSVVAVFGWQCKGDTQSATGVGEKALTVVKTDSGTVMAEVNPTIVWVNLDSLTVNYQYYKDAEKRLQGQMASIEKQLDDQMQALQQKVAGYQAQAQNMTRQQAEEAEKTVGTEQEKIMKYKAEKEKSFGKMQEDLDRDLKKKINDYLAQLSKTNGYQYILTYNSAGLGMLYGDKSLDITSKVIAELNDLYKKEKK